ncbi:DUF928 domain-containing protein [Nostoc sp. FACHB-973]|uniref:DUF928 domain-containing protein n=1 Tax=Desmonostoc muscorum LEGE 12446 TaxID=1828758 RepID=A0A8J6ZR02_DESMC|nr:DUF928 domain-containing protein [Desmonostoc muscorum]MBD2516663.1 DUF928 domain-containing protein [Nostoc sp. FACHB-973]MCF2146580.1 DUF928 domain-containing protein [Desmonostoc muscorum LEGE 12446]
MLLLKTIRGLGMFASLLSPAVLIFPGMSEQVSAQPDRELRISVKFPPTEDRSAPGRTAGGGRRSPEHFCTEPNTTPLTALMPTRDNVGTTVTANPTFFWYVPKTTAKSAEFVVKDEQDNEVYVTNLAIPSTAGIVKFTLPTTVSLQVGQDYTWGLALICNNVDRSRDELVEGIIRRNELSSELKTKLQQALSPLEKAQIYAQAKVWFEAIATLATLQSSQSRQWEELLNSVGLKDIAQQPFVNDTP